MSQKLSSYNCHYCSTEAQHKVQCTQDFLRAKAMEEARKEYNKNFNECDGTSRGQVVAQIRGLYEKWCRKLGVRI